MSKTKNKSNNEIKKLYLKHIENLKEDLKLCGFSLKRCGVRGAPHNSLNYGLFLQAFRSKNWILHYYGCTEFI